jgi:endonuclease III
MFELAAQGYRTLFEQLVAYVISIRTYDEVSLPTAVKLFARARTAQDVAKLSFREIDALISPSNFHEGKARQIHTIAKRVVEEFNGQLPCDFEVLTSLHGVGPKCAKPGARNRMRPTADQR